MTCFTNPETGDPGEVLGEIDIPEADREKFKNDEPFTTVITDAAGNAHTLTGDGKGNGETGIRPSQIEFRTGAGYTLRNDTSSQTLTLTGGKPDDAQDVYALYKDEKGEYHTVGKLKVVSYAEKSFNVTLVPIKVGTTTYTTDVEAVKNKLKDIYGPLGISWNVTEDKPFEYSSADIDSDGSGLLSQYTSDMRALNAAYKSSRGTDKNTVYLFVMNNAKVGKLNPEGEMPKGKQYGYLFTGNGKRIPWTVAHELAHGRFKLYHTYDGAYGGFEDILSDNLMHSGEHLAKWQWDAIFNTALLTNPFESDEDAMAVMTTQSESETETISIEDGKESKYNLYFTPSGTLYALSPDAKPSFKTTTNIPVPKGALVSFKLRDKDYLAKYEAKTNGKWRFIGYFEKGSKYPLSSFISEQELEQIVSKLKKGEPTTELSTNSASYVLVIGVAGGEFTTGVGSRIILEVAGTALAKYLPNIVSIKNFTVATIALGFVHSLFTSPPYSPYAAEGTVVDALPVTMAVDNSDSFVINPPISIPISIPHKIPDTKGDCQVYVIWKQKELIIEVAKYGMTCQDNMNDNDECNPRPEYQCNKFNKNNDGYKYFYSWVTPYKVPKEIALIIERSMTANYVITHKGELPSHHYLPCFTKNDNFDKRIDLAKKWIEEMITKYGK